MEIININQKNLFGIFLRKIIKARKLSPHKHKLDVVCSNLAFNILNYIKIISNFFFLKK